LPRPGRISASRLRSVDGCVNDPYARIRSALLVTSPRSVAAGWSAALLHGGPTAFIDGRWDGSEKMPVVVNSQALYRQRTGIQRSFSRLRDDDIVERHGMLVTSGVRTLFDTIRFARGRSHALQVGDACVRFGLASRPELLEYAVERPGWPGIRRVRELRC
jgi:hypothetical protein